MKNDGSGVNSSFYFIFVVTYLRTESFDIH